MTRDDGDDGDSGDSLAGDLLFITHVTHVIVGVSFELAQAIQRAKVDRHGMVIVTGRGVGEIDMHLANRIDGHKVSSLMDSSSAWEVSSGRSPSSPESHDIAVIGNASSTSSSDHAR